ncbi:MAG: FAD-binding protein [Legionella sp.]|jgi:hypothetical protein
MFKNNKELENLINSLKEKSTTELILPSDARYDNARKIYNRMHDCYPGVIVRTMNIEDLRHVINYAFTHNIVLAIRGGGHHIGGFGTCNEGILVDFSPFKHIHIDSTTNTVAVDPGVCLGDIDKALSDAGYVIPTGTVSETGLAGLTLGGGIGWLVAQYGLTCDQLCGADVLLADGRLVKAEDPEHADLLWALRGGGGNFGIVVQFRYRLNPLPKTVCGMGFVAWEHVTPVMHLIVDYLHNSCPTSMTIAPIFTKNKSGTPELRVDFCCANGTQEDVAQLLGLSSLIEWSEVREWEFAAWQKEFDQAFLPPMRGYWKASYMQILSPEIISAIIHAFEASEIRKCTIMIEQLHGAFKSFDQSTSAFPLRQNNFGIVIAARWEDSAEDAKTIGWVRQTFNAIDPQGTSATYVNYTGDDDQRAVTTLLSNTHSRLAQVKSLYDPDNCFKRNHNVIPAK